MNTTSSGIASARVERGRVARERVVADHRLLRHLMAGVLTAAREAFGTPKQRSQVAITLRILCDELGRHLDYEERVIAPLMYDAGSGGPVRVADMTADHAGQRAVLVALLEDATLGRREMTDLVDELSWFARSLERDMEREERSLFRDDVLGLDASVAG